MNVSLGVSVLAALHPARSRAAAVVSAIARAVERVRLLKSEDCSNTFTLPHVPLIAGGRLGFPWRRKAVNQLCRGCNRAAPISKPERSPPRNAQTPLRFRKPAWPAGRRCALRNNRGGGAA